MMNLSALYKLRCKIIYCLVLFGFLSACYQPPERLEVKSDKEYREALLRVNKYLIKKDAELIERYVERRGWQMERFATGLWMMKYQEGTGANVTKGKKVALSYTLELLDGTFCYKSELNAPKMFVAGKGNVESGLEEAILKLKVGDAARLILPPHLAHGLIGDQNKIPPRATIVYNVRIEAVDDM